MLLATATANPDTTSFFVCTSIKRAVSLIWPDLERLNGQLPRPGRVNLTKHAITMPNGSLIEVTGVENRKMADDTVRGRQKIKRVIIEEAQDWQNDLLAHFIGACVRPRLSDVEGGITFIGTGSAKRGYWYERTVDPTYSIHRATAYDNPIAPPGAVQAMIDLSCQERGVSIEDATIQREYFARFVNDDQLTCFPYDDARNGYDAAELPKGLWYYALAQDVGTVDQTAVHVWGWVKHDPHIWMRESVAKGNLGASAQVALMKETAAKYRKLGTVVGAHVDPGGGGKAVIADLNATFDANFEAAEKSEKVAATLTMRDGLRNGSIKIPRADRVFIDELQIPEFDPDDVGGKKLKANQHWPDRVDAALYGYRLAAKFHRWRPPKPPLTEQEKFEARIAENDRRRRRSYGDI